MEYNLVFGNYTGVFAMPAEAADRYINEANKDELKVLLYVFRHSGETLDDKNACELLGLSPEGLKNALDFWAQRNIISYENKIKKTSSAAEQKKTRVQTSARRVFDIPAQYGQEDIAQKSQSNPEIKFLLEAVPNQLGRLLSPADCSTLLYLYEGAGIPADVIIMLIGYCASSGKGNMRYIEKMALSWAEEGIDTHEKAESKICQLEARHSYEGKMRSVLGIGDRALSTDEVKIFPRWNEWKMSPDLVKYAFDICVTRKGKYIINYMNSILKSWHEKGFTTVEQARNEHKQGRGGSGGNSNKAPSYDIDEYVRLSLKRLNNE